MHKTNNNSLNISNIKVTKNKMSEIKLVSKTYPFLLSASYSKLIKKNGDAIWKQCIPDILELDDRGLTEDPLAESLLSPVPGVIHRYPDRVVMIVSNRCPVYCRFCMRKRDVGGGEERLRGKALELALQYVASKVEIKDVILSGGDPLMLDDASLFYILKRLRSIQHVSVIRIGTRMPVTMPERITIELCAILKKFHPLYINTHFNHPAEITTESANACNMLADAGIPLGNQTVLLRDVNDDILTMRELTTGLLGIRVKPYYLHQMDLAKGTAHFRTPISTGIEIIKGLRGYVSGMAVPHFVVDLPGGKGKVPVLPDLFEKIGDTCFFTTYLGERVAYKDITTPQR